MGCPVYENIFLWIVWSKKIYEWPSETWPGTLKIKNFKNWRKMVPKCAFLLIHWCMVNIFSKKPWIHPSGSKEPVRVIKLVKVWIIISCMHRHIATDWRIITCSSSIPHYPLLWASFKYFNQENIQPFNYICWHRCIGVPSKKLWISYWQPEGK